MRNRINFDKKYINLPRMLRCARAIHEKGLPLEGCFGFIDGTVRPISRPVFGQESVYNGHHRVHALKYQSMIMADGIISSLWGPFPARNHDMRMLAESKILENIEDILQNFEDPLYIYGDMGYSTSRYIISPFQGALSNEQRQFNLEMSRARETVKWGFKNFLQLFSFNRDKYNLKTGISPVGKYYSVSVILTNCHNCCYPNQISQYFECLPSSLEEYLAEF